MLSSYQGPDGTLDADTLENVKTRSALVVGAGAVGLMSAFGLERAGFEVTLVDPHPGHGAVWQAGGMLAPVSESHFGEAPLVRLLVEAAKCWEQTAPLLRRELGDIGYRTCGTLLVALDAGDRAELSRRAELMRHLDLAVCEVERDQILELEPNISPRARAAILAPEDHQVDNRRLVDGLLGYLDDHGARCVTARAASIGEGAVELDDGTTLHGDLVVVCPGAHLNALGGLDSRRVPSVRPVKGHILRLAGPPLLNRTVRAMVHGRPIYLVPRADGEIVVGASVEEMGFDTTVRAGEVHRLLDDARLIVPGVDELELVEAGAGLRPGSPDNAPTIAMLSERTIVASGLYRNGVLLAPLCAELVVSLATGSVHPASALVEATHR